MNFKPGKKKVILSLIVALIIAIAFFCLILFDPVPHPSPGIPGGNDVEAGSMLTGLLFISIVSFAIMFLLTYVINSLIQKADLTKKNREIKTGNIQKITFEPKKNLFSKREFKWGRLRRLLFWIAIIWVVLAIYYFGGILLVCAHMEVCIEGPCNCTPQAFHLVDAIAPSLVIFLILLSTRKKDLTNEKAEKKITENRKDSEKKYFMRALVGIIIIATLVLLFSFAYISASLFHDSVIISQLGLFFLWYIWYNLAIPIALLSGIFALFSLLPSLKGKGSLRVKILSIVTLVMDIIVILARVKWELLMRN